MIRTERRRKDKIQRKAEQLKLTREKRLAGRRVLRERFSVVSEPLTGKQKALMALEILWISFGRQRTASCVLPLVPPAVAAKKQ